MIAQEEDEGFITHLSYIASQKKIKEIFLSDGIDGVQSQ